LVPSVHPRRGRKEAVNPLSRTMPTPSNGEQASFTNPNGDQENTADPTGAAGDQLMTSHSEAGSPNDPNNLTDYNEEHAEGDGDMEEDAGPLKGMSMSPPRTAMRNRKSMRNHKSRVPRAPSPGSCKSKSATPDAPVP
jgi:hypothetical protein